jgi:hypothetical protein
MHKTGRRLTMSITKRLIWVAIPFVLTAQLGCSSTKTVSDVATEVRKAEKVREIAQAERLEKKQGVLEARIKATPKWAIEPMKSDGSGVYAVGFGDSDKLQVALKKAMLEAEFGLAKQYRQELSGSERMGVTDKGEQGVIQSYNQLIDKLVASVPMNGFEVVEQEVKPVHGQYSAWVLLRMTHDQMVKMASKESRDATDAGMSAAFEDLERRVRERQANQTTMDDRRQEMRLKAMSVGTELARGSNGAMAGGTEDEKAGAK